MCGISLVIDGLSARPRNCTMVVEAAECCQGTTTHQRASGETAADKMPPLCARQSCEGGNSASVVVDVSSLSAAVSRRGPDGTHVICECVSHNDSSSTSTTCSPKISFVAQGSVLSLRRGRGAKGDGGDGVVQQPLRAQCVPNLSSSSSWLLWNGEVFGGHSVVVPVDECDTPCVLAQLRRCEDDDDVTPSSSLVEQVGSRRVETFLRRARAVLESAHGPYAIIYYAASLGVVLFGRDPVGRRSLVAHRCLQARRDGEEGAPTEQWILSSVAAPHVGLSGLHMATHGDGADSIEQQQHNRVASARRGDDADNGTEAGCWWEVPTGGLFALRVAEANQNEEVATIADDATAIPSYWSVPWDHHAAYATHPVLRTAEMIRSLAPTFGVASSSELSDELLDDAVRRVGYRCLGIQQNTSAAGMPQSSEDSSAECAWTYLRALAHAVWVRVVAHTTGGDSRGAPLGLLFSGGIDSTVLATLAHYLLPITVPIELINVAFGEFPEQTPDRIGCVLAMHELLALPPPLTLAQDSKSDVPSTREWRLVLVDATQQEALEAQPRVLELIYPRTSVMDLNIGTALWFASRGIGRVYVLSSTSVVIEGGLAPLPVAANSKHLRIARAVAAVATSNGSVNGSSAAEVPTGDDDLEGARSTEAATTVDKFQPLVDVLVQEGFDGNGSDGGRVLLSTLGKEYGDVLTPAWRSLGYRKLGVYLNDAACAGVVSFGGGSTSKYVSLKRDADIRRAMERVAAGREASLLPFLRHATPTEATSISPPSSDLYTASSRVLLLGMGADESLGGYMRYRRTFEREGVNGLTSEMQRDFARLWTRNLGRDDRVVADHGREGRFPFLAEEVFFALSRIVHLPQTPTCINDGEPLSIGRTDEPQQQCQFLNRLAEVVDVALPEGVGDKKILRTCARMLGLRDVSKLQKRAIQFGTRIADRKLQGNAPLRQALSNNATAAQGGVRVNAKRSRDDDNS